MCVQREWKWVWGGCAGELVDSRVWGCSQRESMCISRERERKRYVCSERERERESKCVQREQREQRE